jgi:hypothetical protein
MPQTRSTNTNDDVWMQFYRIMDEEIDFLIKFDHLATQDPCVGTYPVNPTEQEARHIVDLKHRMYKAAAARFKRMGVFSSSQKKELLKECLLKRIGYCVDDIEMWNQYYTGNTRITRAVIQLSVYKALVNGFDKAKLSDMELTVFNDE